MRNGAVSNWERTEKSVSDRIETSFKEMEAAWQVLGRPQAEQAGRGAEGSSVFSHTVSSACVWSWVSWCMSH